MLLIESCLTVAALVVALAFPQVGSRWFEVCERAFAKLAQKPRLAVVVVGLAALAARAALLPILPIAQPGINDEFGYILLADTFAHGRLTNPTHPMWVHFESVHIIWHPTYTAKFYPAQGLIMALGQVIMGHPFWGVWLSVGLMCAALCWMLQGWMPPGWALLGGFLAVIRLATFSYWANSYWGGAVAATGGALVLGALPRIKRSQDPSDALLMGLGFAILANSRPYEALFFGLPVAGALAVWMFGNKLVSGEPAAGQALRPLLRKEKVRRWCKCVVTPFLLVLVLTGCAMAYYFWRTTGSPWDTPYLVDARTNNPVPYFPWLPMRPVPAYHHADMRDYFLGKLMRQYKESRSIKGVSMTVLSVVITTWRFYLGGALALPLLLTITTLPYSFSWRDVSRSTRFLLMVCGTVLAGCSLPYIISPHYVAPITCAIYALILQAMRRLRCQRARGQPMGLFIGRAVPLICLAMLMLQICAYRLYPRHAVTISNVERARTLTQLQAYPGGQLAIVRSNPAHPKGGPWVYNEADIDRAKVVWAHDMGSSRNNELIDYFHDRHAWLVEADETPLRVSPYPGFSEPLH
jgi:hypothetical protein